MHISQAQVSDIPDLIDLLSILFSQEQEFTPNAKAQTTALKQIITNPAIGQIIVARENGRPVGMVNLLYTLSTAIGGKTCLLEDMIVSPAFRNQKIGAQLLEYAIDYAKRVGCGRITLLTDTTNITAQRFYRRFGFKNSTMLPMRLFLDTSSQTGDKNTGE